MKKILWTIVFVLINVTVIAVTAVSEFGNSANAAELKATEINWWYLVPAVICFAMAMLLDISKYALMTRRLTGARKNHANKDNNHASTKSTDSSTKKMSRKDVWQLVQRTVILGRYYDNITPAAVGGQPYQIYHMHKYGHLSTGLATTIPIFGMISLQIGFIIIALIVFLIGGALDDNPALFVTAWIGLGFYAFWPVVVAMATFLPKLTTKIIKLIVRFFSRIKIIKNREEALKKSEKDVREYVDSVKMILKKPGLFLEVILMSIVYNLLIASIPWFVLTAFGGDVNYLSCLGLTIAVMAAVYFVPTPGNAGAAEGTFYLVFSALSTGYVFWAMLFWRFFSYYIYIIMGIITYFVMKVKRRR